MHIMSRQSACRKTLIFALLAIASGAAIAQEHAERGVAASARRATTMSGRNPVRVSTRPPAAATRKRIKVRQLHDAFGAAATIRKYDPRTDSAVRLAADATAALKPGQYLTVSADRLPLPLLTDEAGRRYRPVHTIFVAVDTDGDRHSYRLDEFTEGFSWQKARRSFQADLFLKVSDIASPRSDKPLVTPITVRVTGPALRDGPVEVRIIRIGPSGEARITLGSDARHAPVEVTLRSPIVPDALKSLRIGVHRPTLQLSANPRTIPAFGIGSTQILLASGEALPENFPLTLSSTDGVLVNPALMADAAGRASAILWSGGPGDASLTINDSRFDAAPLRIHFAWPIKFLLATLAGSTLGAGFLLLWDRKYAVRRTLACLLFGVGITFAAFAGFDIPRLLDLPAGRSGLIVPGATAFIAALMTVPIFGAMSWFKSGTAREGDRTDSG